MVFPVSTSEHLQLGYTENNSNHFACPCDGDSKPIPPYVGDDYFCESGFTRLVAIHHGMERKKETQYIHYIYGHWVLL